MTNKRISDIKYLGKEGGWWMQAVSYDNRMHEEDPTQCMVNLMNVLRTPLEMEMLAEENAARKADPDGDHPVPKMASIRDYVWGALQDNEKEMYADLHLFGEHTRIVNRVFHEVDGVVHPVILADDKPEDDQLLAVDAATGISMKVEEA
jgi:hypothetical protein